jgi:hypothetical protein
VPEDEGREQEWLRHPENGIHHIVGDKGAPFGSTIQ